MQVLENIILRTGFLKLSGSALPPAVLQSIRDGLKRGGRFAKPKAPPLIRKAHEDAKILLGPVMKREMAKRPDLSKADFLATLKQDLLPLGRSDVEMARFAKKWPRVMDEFMTPSSQAIQGLIRSGHPLYKMLR